jgi:hypothetical protein
VAYTIEQEPGEAIFVIKLSNPFDFQREPAQIITELYQLSAGTPGTSYVIYDVRDLKVNFSDLVIGLAASFRSNMPELDELKTRYRMIAVGASDLVKLGVSSARQLQYGGANIELFDAPDEALAFAREQLSGL